MSILTKKQNSLIAFALIALLALALSACGAVEAQTTTGGNAVTGGITVVGHGEAIGAPDQAQIQVGVETLAETVAAATADNEATVRAILDALAEAGIASEDIQTVNYSVWPEQRYSETGPAGIVGYRVNNQVNVTVRDISKVSEVLVAVTDAGANSIYGINFTVADPAALEAEAREAAIADARARAASLAGLTEVELGEVVAISEVIGQPPIFLEGRGAGGASLDTANISIAPGQYTFNVQVQVTFAIE